MNVLAIADRHPKIDILETVETKQIDLIITLGDLTREDILPLEQITNIPKIGVYGNHDSGTYMPDLGIWDMHLKTWNYQGFDALRGYVEHEQPKILMHGHTYPAEETVIKQFGSTRIEYVYGYNILTM